MTEWTDGPEIRHGMRDATYFPLLDVIGLPNRESFTSAPEYYSKLFYEMGRYADF
ncbi:zincin-like metallopeptidase domain-containing protein [Cerasicoccus arenae]|uniref:Polyvalent protein metallopeptidase domain-containing protein n=1 Tax=Cerasicoccus arenae TaxID=424488 RepID=A0A8J3DBU3_9BACT|nr:zincin-like metallopeptidase domain-containing protein [Cerasicoccus arenae]MBK1858758.1 hypothetical protein [Cerasicoccus arenae]GHC07315.1 hypothetical protein GCM10007047_25540 [Cerasicoccus arenae]